MQTATPRYNIYIAIHKGLRAWMSDTLIRLGRTDWADPAHTQESLDALQALLEACSSHLGHEDAFVHAAMEARRPGSAVTTAADHREHEHAIASLRDDAISITRMPREQRAAAGESLYRRVGLFVAENLEHMVCEEVDNIAVLWSAYTDEEIIQIEQALVATIPAEKKGPMMRWMLPALSHPERAGMLAGLRQHAPAEVFEGTLAMLRPLLDARDWRKLCEALEINPQQFLRAA